MNLSNPQRQLVLLSQTGQADRLFVFIQTHFDLSSYENAGVDSISGPDMSKKVTITIKVTKSGTALRLNKTVYHQVELEDLGMGDVSSTEIIVKEGTTTLATSLVAHDESEVIVKPDKPSKN
jgi:hypothetical protein